MNRSDYTDDSDYDNWRAIMYRGAVKSATRGQRGQKLLRDIAQAMDAMPEKVLIADDLARDGQVCALGAAFQLRGINATAYHAENYIAIASALDAAPALVREIAFLNDECGDNNRWLWMRNWVDSEIKK